MDPAVRTRKHLRLARTGLAVALLAGVLAPIALVLSSAPAGAQTPATTYSAAAPTLASITSPASCTATSTSTCAPWNEWQGDPGTASAPNATDAQNCSGDAATGYGSNCLLFPTYNPTGGPTTTTNNGAGGASVTEPNLSVAPGAGSGTDGVAPYPSGVVGTPGPLDAYCGSGDEATESTQSVSRMTPGTTLPLAPAYFPHIVRNADGSLTGYFDYRPKDADEALVAATSTDGGVDWTYDGEALEQNPGYCPSADTNDDGQGHANIVTLSSGDTFLYTLPRAAGDMQGVGLDIHQFNPTADNPLGNGAQALPAAEETGVDPDTFATAGANVLTTGGATIAVTQTGSANSPQQLVTGGFVDLSQDAVPNPNEVINCTVSSYNALSGCTSATPITVNQGDLIEQVIAYVSAQTGPATIPPGPNTSNGDGGLGTIDVSPSASTATATSGSTNLGFTSPLTGSTLNANAPNRVYVDGVTAYCAQSNNNPTTKIENCTTGPTGAPLPLSTGMIITSDPIIPSTAYASDPSAGGMTTGLIAPDGIVGVLPNYPGVPAGATAIMYTEKELNYYLAGDSTNAIGTVATSKKAGVGWGAGAQTIDFIASPYLSENMPNPASVTASTPVTVTMGLTLDDGSGTAAMVPITCTGLAAAGANSTLTGCTVPVADQNYTEAAKTYVGAPGAATVALSTLEQQGEGSASNAVKLYKNNEDVSILRVAYTTDGSTFSYAGLPNDGIVSDCVNTSSTVTLQNQTLDPGVPEVGCTGSYQGVNNPDQQNNPPNGLNSYATNEGTPGGSNGTDTGSVTGGDATEMRWVGSAGSIITNPNGTYGLFLSGAWAADGDSDAFNQVFYSEGTTGTDGTVTWSVPTPVISTDYSFAASYNQDNNVNGDGSQPVGISAYYEGRAYGPSVVQNPDGTLTMVFAGYRFPKSIVNAGSVLGDGATAGTTGGATAPSWTVGPDDLNMYRNILTTTLSQSTSPAVPTTTSVAASPDPATFGQTEVLTATVAPQSPGTGTPTGSVSFTGSGGAVLCQADLNESSPDTASCDYPYTAPTTDSVSASYAGDANYASSVSTTPADVTINQATPTTPTISNLPSGGVYGSGFTATVDTDGDGTTSVTSSTQDVCTASGLAVSYVGVGPCTLTAQVASGTDYTGATGNPQTFSVTQGQTGTTLASSTNPSVTGQSVTITATVSAESPSSGTPSGNVTFSFGTSGTAPTCSSGSDTVALSAGQATCTIAGTPAQSPLAVSASYTGSTDFSGSGAGPLNQAIDKAATAISLSSSANPDPSGQAVTFTAAIAAKAPGVGVPSGAAVWNITSRGGAAVTCATTGSSLSGNTLDETCTVGAGSLLASGSPYTVAVSYSGDANFNGSSKSTAEQVQLGSSTVKVTTAVSGSSATITATVKGTPAGNAVTGTATFLVSTKGGSSVTCKGGNSKALSGAEATCSLSGLKSANSPYSVSVTYAGNAYYGPSVSTTKTFTG